MYCNHCGKEIPDGSKFCGGCGSSLQTPPAVAAPSTLVQKQKLTAPAAGWISIAFSALVLISFFFTWVTLPEIFMYDGIDPEQKLLGLTKLLFEIGSEDEPLFTFFALLIGVFAVISAVLQIVTILGNIDLVKGSKNTPDSRIISASILSVLLFVIIRLIVTEVNNEIKDASYGLFGQSDLVSVGSGAVFCLVISIAAIIGNIVLTNSLHSAERKQNLTVCPHCGHTYEKLTAAARCPACRKYASDPITGTPKSIPVPAPAPKPDTITCPFCKTVYPKGTVFCDKCKAQIGASSPVKASAAYCSGCGRQLSASDAFCSGCGKRL